MSFWRGHRCVASLSLLLAAITGGSALAQLASSSSFQAAPRSSSTPASATDIGSYNAPLPYTRDLAVSAFAQVSKFTNGNFIRVDTTSSVGGLLSFRQAHRLWLGYEANYGLTRYTDTYYFGAIRVPHDTHEISVAYLLQGPQYAGFRPFLTLGGGALVFSSTASGTTGTAGAPASSGVQGYGTDAKRLFVYGIGIQHTLLSDRLGVRVQFRGLKYGTPAFGQLNLNTHRGRTSDEPTFGVYYRF